MPKTLTTEIDTHPYPGDDRIFQKLQLSTHPLACEIFEQPEICIVLGKAGKIEKEIHLEHVKQDTLKVYRREGGGGTVILTPGMLIITVAGYVKNPFGNKRYFRLIQEPIQEALQRAGCQHISQRGISDIAWKDKKILGSSMRRKRTYLLYQAVLMVHTERTLFDRYLLHPPREPDYRENRSHNDFTISLQEAGYPLQPKTLAQQMQKHMQQRLNELLQDDFVWDVKDR